MPPKIDKRFKRWKPKEEGRLKHRIGVRGHHYIYYDGKYDIDDIRDFARIKSNELKLDKRIKQIQVGIVYENEGSRVGKSTKTGEEVDVRDLRDEYDHDIGDIKGFYFVI